VEQVRPGRRRARQTGVVPDWIDGQWTGPDVWTTGSGQPSAARYFREKLGYDWRGRKDDPTC
jgi:hypothetical protein